MRIFLLVGALALALHLQAERTLNVAPAVAVSIALDLDAAEDFPIFGRKKTSNKKQLKFATKRSRRHGKGVMRARKNRGKRKVKQGGRSKKKEGCNT